MTIHLDLDFSPQTLERLQTHATDLNLSLEQVITLAVEDFLEDDSDEEILAGIRQGMLDALAGNTIPADQALADLKRELGL